MNWNRRSRRRSRAVFAAACAAGLMPVVFAAADASAQMVYEPFDYGSAAVGTPLGNLTGTSPTFTGYTNPSNSAVWYDANTTASGSGGSELTLAGGNLSPTIAASQGLPAPSGGMVHFNVDTTASRSARLQLGPGVVSSGTVYYSMLFRVTDTTDLNAGGGAFFASLNDSPGTFTPGNNPSSDPARLQIRLGADSSHIQVGLKGNNNSTANYTTTSFNAGPTNPDTIFVVLGYTFVDGVSNDVNSIWVNPGSTSFGAATPPPADFTQTGNDVAAIVSLLLRQGNTAIAKGIDVDEVRIDTAWSQVAPAAGTTWLGSAVDGWSDGTKWSGGVAPNSAGAFVNFTGSAGGSVIVDQPVTIGTMNVKGPGPFTIVGSTITFDAGGAAGTSAINVTTPMDPTGPGVPVATSHTIANAIHLNNALEANVGVGQNLNLNGPISGAATITKNGGGYLTLNSGGQSTQTGDVTINNGTLVMYVDGDLGAASNQLVFNGGALLALGSFTSARNMLVNAVTSGIAGTFGHGTIDTNSYDVAITGTLAGPGTLNKTGDGELTVRHVRTNGLNVARGGVRIAAGGGTNGVSTVKTLAIAGATDAWTSHFDLNDSGLILDYDTTSPIATIQNQIKSGFNGGSWNGNGINSTAAQPQPGRTSRGAIGYVESSQKFSSFPATFMGQPVNDNTAILVRYTLAGDANLDGTVDLTDFTFLAANFNKTGGAVWLNGDFNYDGNVDLTDFTFLAADFNQSVPAGGLGTIVPEPALLGLAGLAGLAALNRIGRRRR
jgi:autotransporter-associated beta strand protein